MHQATCVTCIRRARYLCLAKTRLEHLAAATAINVIPLDAWYAGHPLDRTRTTHLQRIDLHQQHQRELGSRIPGRRKPGQRQDHCSRSGRRPDRSPAGRQRQHHLRPSHAGATDGHQGRRCSHRQLTPQRHEQAEKEG